MAYTKEQRKLARELGMHLVTIDVGGVNFCDPVPEEERDALLRYALDLIERRRQAKKAAQPKEA